MVNVFFTQSSEGGKGRKAFTIFFFAFFAELFALLRKKFSQK